MNPADVERARGILKNVHRQTVERLVHFVIENEETLASRGEYDSSGGSERLCGFQQEIFVLCYLLGSLPSPPQPTELAPRT
jgi:hypothetical protein